MEYSIFNSVRIAGSYRLVVNKKVSYCILLVFHVRTVGNCGPSEWDIACCIYTVHSVGSTADVHSVQCQFTVCSVSMGQDCH